MSSDWSFTPEAPEGGWHIFVEDEYGGYLLQEEQEESEANRKRDWDAIDRLLDQQHANVNLIAAAPRMYRALKEMIRFADEEQREDEGIDLTQAREVIDLIDGGTQ